MTSDRHLEAERLESRLARLVTEWARGRVALRQVLGLSDEELYAAASLGHTLFLEGKVEPARAVFDGLAALDPAEAYYQRALGAVCWRLGRPDDALDHLDRAVRIAPRDVASRVDRAEVHVARGEREAARDDLRAALDAAAPEDAALASKAGAMLQSLRC